MITNKNIKDWNEKVRTMSPNEIVATVLKESNNPIVTTNFRPYESAVLHLVTRAHSDIKVIWCDTGYNTENTYQHARKLIDELDLNIALYVPQQSRAYRDALMGIPSIDDSLHSVFTEQVKLEPFRRAFKIHQPDVWFTNIRKGQTQHRNNLDILSFNKEGILKVSPFYYWSDSELDVYLKTHALPNEFDYYDPTKVLSNRECGLHI